MITGGKEHYFFCTKHKSLSHSFTDALVPAGTVWKKYLSGSVTVSELSQNVGTKNVFPCRHSQNDCCHFVKHHWTYFSSEDLPESSLRILLTGKGWTFWILTRPPVTLDNISSVSFGSTGYPFKIKVMLRAFGSGGYTKTGMVLDLKGTPEIASKTSGCLCKTNGIHLFIYLYFSFKVFRKAVGSSSWVLTYCIVLHQYLRSLFLKGVPNRNTIKQGMIFSDYGAMGI